MPIESSGGFPRGDGKRKNLPVGRFIDAGAPFGHWPQRNPNGLGGKERGPAVELSAGYKPLSPEGIKS